MNKKNLPIFQMVTALVLGALGVGLVTNAAAVGEGIARGLTVCGNVLIPALFPFMAFSVFLSITRYGRILSVPLRPITTRLYKLPSDMGVVVLLSMIGGYPVGAKMIAGLLEEGRIDRATAERMLCFCVNSGPSFLITAVGLGLLGDRKAGVVLFATQTAATLLIGLAVSRKAAPPPKGEREPAYAGGAEALVRAVNSASTGMIAMCAFAILFSGLLSLLEAGGVMEGLAGLLPFGERAVGAAVSGLLEVTAGCIGAARVGGSLAFGMTSCIVSFGGLSVLFQVMSCFHGMSVRFGPLLLSRLAHMALSTSMAMPLYRLLCKSQPVWLAAAPPLAQMTGKTALVSVALLAMVTVFLLQIRYQPEELERKPLKTLVKRETIN